MWHSCYWNFWKSKLKLTSLLYMVSIGFYNYQYSKKHIFFTYTTKSHHKNIIITIFLTSDNINEMKWNISINEATVHELNWQFQYTLTPQKWVVRKIETKSSEGDKPQWTLAYTVSIPLPRLPSSIDGLVMACFVWQWKIYFFCTCFHLN